MGIPRKLRAVQHILKDLGLPLEQQSDLAGYCLLALLNMTTAKAWIEADNPLLGITPIMEWVKKTYKKRYAANTRETFRRFAMHQFVQAGLAVYNPDKPGRAVNSPNAVYQIEPAALDLIRTYGTSAWKTNLDAYLSTRVTIQSRIDKQRKQEMVPVKLGKDVGLELSPGEHSTLIKQIIEQFGARFLPGGQLLYAGDTGGKWAFYSKEKLEALGIHVDSHGRMPDVVIYSDKENWLVLIEAVTSHGPMNVKRHQELTTIFGVGSAGLVFVTAFPTRKLMGKYLADIAWETEVWVSESPSHMIHFNGVRFLGPYEI